MEGLFKGGVRASTPGLFPQVFAPAEFVLGEQGVMGIDVQVIGEDANAEVGFAIDLFKPGFEAHRQEGGGDVGVGEIAELGFDLFEGLGLVNVHGF